jgi:hypothetical protein
MAKKRVGNQIGNLIPTTKSRESPQFPCVQMACHIPLESSQRGLQLCFRFHFNQRSAHKIMGPQSCQSLSCGNSGTKWHLGASLVAKHRIYFKGEGGGFPQVWAMVSLVNLCLPVVRSCTKMLKLRINQLVVWFVQGRMNDWIACQSS